MIYPTIRATVRRGKIQILDDVDLPEDATLLITVLEENAWDAFTLGEHLIMGLEDILAGQIVEASTSDELGRHLDTLFDEA